MLWYSPILQRSADGVLERTAFVVNLFDEAFNNTVQKGQVDMHKRF